ncbi:NADH-quinone oxidoreductase subunit F, partial [bacterium]|nr:NADH-quinone oxidoreductase subunit F [bacterium]
MADNQYKILSRRFDRDDAHNISVYEADGGYVGLKKVLSEMSREQVIAEVKESGLRGRGGAGFPAGVKWGFVPEGVEDIYFMVNADESEPGTFKDRFLLDYDPHMVIEGSIISSWAVRAKLCIIY